MNMQFKQQFHCAQNFFCFPVSSGSGWVVVLKVDVGWCDDTLIGAFKGADLAEEVMNEWLIGADKIDSQAVKTVSLEHLFEFS